MENRRNEGKMRFGKEKKRWIEIRFCERSVGYELTSLDATFGVQGAFSTRLSSGG